MEASRIADREMEDRGAAAGSQQSECSAVLDISPTYKITDSALTEDPAAGGWEESLCGASASASPEPSPSYPDCSSQHFEDPDNITLEDFGICISALSLDDLPAAADERSFADTLLPSQEAASAADDHDADLRACLDAFYELSAEAGDGPVFQKLTDKISELKQKNNLYALRSFQMAKIVLSQQGTNVLQSCSADNVFASTSTKPDINVKPVPGLSEDVIRFIMDSNTQKETEESSTNV